MRDDVNNFAFDQFDISIYKETIFNILDKYAPIKQKYLRVNEAPFMTKELHRAIMKRSRLRNNFLGTKSQEDRSKYNRQRSLCKKLLRTTKTLYFSILDITKYLKIEVFGKHFLPFFVQNAQKIIKSSSMKTIKVLLMTTNNVKFFVATSPILFLNFKFQVHPETFQT